MLLRSFLIPINLNFLKFRVFFCHFVLRIWCVKRHGATSQHPDVGERGESTAAWHKRGSHRRAWDADGIQYHSLGMSRSSQGPLYIARGWSNLKPRRSAACWESTSCGGTLPLVKSIWIPFLLQKAKCVVSPFLWNFNGAELQLFLSVAGPYSGLEHHHLAEVNLQSPNHHEGCWSKAVGFCSQSWFLCAMSGVRTELLTIRCQRRNIIHEMSLSNRFAPLLGDFCCYIVWLAQGIMHPMDARAAIDAGAAGIAGSLRVTPKQSEFHDPLKTQLHT